MEKITAFVNEQLKTEVPQFNIGDTVTVHNRIKEGDKVRQCFEFVVKCMREDKPVFFHCSIGSDRTGTMAILLLGALGVPEPDVCKDYELSYFAPEAWSMTNGVCNRTRTNKSRYLDAINYLLKFGKGNFRDHVESYLLSIGVAQKDIDDFRSMMLMD